MTGRNAKEPAENRPLTRKRDLRTGKPIWSAHRRPPIANKPLTHDIDTDVAIVGAGISGALIAEMLSDAGLDVVVVDR